MNKRSPLSFYALIMLTFILLGRPQDFFLWLAPFRLAFLFTLITLITTVMEYRESPWGVLLRSSEGKRYVFLYAVMVLGIPFSYYKSYVFYSVLEYSVILLFFSFCLVQIDTVKKLKTMLFAACCSALFYSASSLTMSEPISDRFSYGSMYDPNDLAYMLVSMLPFSIYYVIENNGLIKRIFAIATLSVSLITILLTGSRGGFLGLMTILMLLFFTNVSGIKRLQKISLVIIAIALFATFGHSINMERYKALTEISSDYNVTDEEGRLSLWKKGIYLAISHPFTGVGVYCMPIAIGEMRAAQGEGSAKWQTAHNSFVEIAAETGLIGFFLFSSMVIGTFKKFSLYRKVQITSPDAKEFQSIASALQVAFIGSLVAAFFLSQAYSIIFGLFFALSAVMKNIALIQSMQTERE